MSMLCPVSPLHKPVSGMSSEYAKIVVSCVVIFEGTLLWIWQFFTDVFSLSQSFVVWGETPKTPLNRWYHSIKF